MKLGEALLLRGDAQKRIAQVREDLVANARVQEGEDPSAPPDDLLRELDRLVGQMRDLVVRINRTNVAARLSDGRTAMEALADRDALQQRIAVLRATIEAAAAQERRYSRSEIRTVRMVDVAALREALDRDAVALRTLNATIQAANWEIDLAD